MFSQNDLLVETARLKKFALRLTRNKFDADDLTQSTCLRALEKSHLFQDGTNLFSWTSKIMYNLFVTNYQRRMKFDNSFDPDSYLKKLPVAPMQEIEVELSNVKRGMAQLNAIHREIILLVCVKGMRYDEVSKYLHIPIGTVRSRLWRAREQLQIIMATPRSTAQARVGTTVPFTQRKQLPAAMRKQANLNKDTSHIPAYIAAKALKSGTVTS